MVLSIGIASLLDPSVLSGADSSFASGELVKPGRVGGVRKVLEVARSSMECLLVFEERLAAACGREGVGSVGESLGFSFLFCWEVCSGLNGMVGEHTITVESVGLCWSSWGGYMKNSGTAGQP